jgi:carbon storage regulator
MLREARRQRTFRTTNSQGVKNMLVLSRKVGEEICIANDIVVVITSIKGSRVSVGIEAPNFVKVLRAELKQPEPMVDRPR